MERVFFNYPESSITIGDRVFVFELDLDGRAAIMRTDNKVFAYPIEFNLTALWSEDIEAMTGISPVVYYQALTQAKSHIRFLLCDQHQIV